MNWSSIRAWLGTVARLVVGGVLIWSGASKLSDPRAFLLAVRAYDVTPEWLSKAIAYGLPVLEVCVGLMLVLGVITRATAIVATVLLGVFLIGMIQAAARGLKLDCGCFGGTGGTTTGPTRYTLDILRDIGMVVLAAYLIVWPKTRLSVDEFLARNDYVPPPSAKRMRSEQGQRKYNALLESRRRDAMIRTRYLTLALGLVVALIGVIGIGVQSGRAKIKGTVTATNASVQNGVVVGKAAPVAVDVFEDFQCPNCETFEQSVSSDVAAKIKAGQIQVRYHTMAFLDSASNGNRYSSRAANAAICASDVNVDTFSKYHGVLYGKDGQGQPVQPAENSRGRTDTELIGYGRQAGMSGSNLTTFQQCVQSEQHKALIEAITDNASKRGVIGTPTVIVNGKKLGTVDRATFDAEVAAALAKAPPNPTGSSSAPGSASPGTSASTPVGSASGSASATPSP